MNKKKVIEIFSRFQTINPHPTTELIYHNQFELLVAVILSAQATDKSVNKATIALFKIVKTPEDMLKLGETKLKNYIKSIGLYISKAKNLIITCQMLIEKFHSKIPHRREDLESLAGVGRKTANVILNTCFGEPVIAVDTHILRVSNRIGLVHTKTPLATEKELMKVIPHRFLHNAHHWLVLHGRYVCIARKPKCPECPIRDLCEYEHKTSNRSP